MAIHTPDGRPAPLGATLVDGGVNFSVFSKTADRLELLLFATAEDPAAQQIIELDPLVNRTNYYWHVFVPDIGHGQVYAWRVYGPQDANQGHRFDGDKVLIDPYARAVTGLGIYDRQAARERGDNCARALRSVVVDTHKYDWQGDTPLKADGRREVIYEMHVGGFTKNPNSGVSENLRGTYAGLVEKIPHLVALGVTTVELLPVHHFDPQDGPEGLTNYWGYSSLSYFAPHTLFSSDQSPTGPVDEFRDMVKALHKAGLKVVLDVVYNHTAEAGVNGPTLSWRGFENSAYYILDKDRSRYADFTGCGNTINANHSVVRRQILDSLKFWVQDMHVDGFRFDLASTMSRGEDGEPIENAPILWAIESDPALAGTRLIAEAWDAAGLYQVGSFTGDRFAQWNGAFRDVVRQFLRGDKNQIEKLMARIVGSPDLFNSVDDRPNHSINFVTCHDGFSLQDLVSYDRKHNDDNRENNRDGSNDNQSWNCGTEGATTDAQILALRRRQVRNFMCLLFLSHGTPMYMMGDEVGQSHLGNNNTWCQDNDLAWMDWRRLESNADLLRFVQNLTMFTNDLRILRHNRFWTATSAAEVGDISWHGTKLGQPDWTPGSHSLAYTLEHQSGVEKVHVMLNAENKVRSFALPPVSRHRPWRLIVDTSAESPYDIELPKNARQVDAPLLELQPHSVVVIWAGE